MNITKKIVAILVGLAMTVTLASPVFAVTAEELLAQIQQLQQQLNQLMAQYQQLVGAPPPVGVPAACSGITFTRNLSQGMSGSDVKCLQALLNTDEATQVAASGVGSKGNETTFFGPLTKAAVIKFQEKYAAEVLTPLGLTAGTGFVGSKTRAKLNSILEAGVVAPPAEEEVPPAVTPGLTVELAADTPAAGTIVASSTVTELAKIKFTNGDATDVKVTTIKFTRTGISDDATLPALYLFEGYKRLGDEGTLSSGVVTFNMAGGIFTVPAGGSKTISVRADVASGTSGQTVGVKLAAATDITSDASAINGTFPISGNLMSIAAATNQAAVTIGTASPSSDANIDAATDFVAWQNTLSVSTQDVKLEYLKLTQIGSISASDLENIRLWIAGAEVATGKLEAGLVGQDLVFDLSSSPVTLTKGTTKQLTVYVDIVGGASKTMRFGLEKKADIFLKDTAYGNYVAISGTVPSRTGTQTIQQGTITLTKATDSPSANVVNGASNVSLAKFNIRANGEEIKINSLRVQIYTDDSEVYSLRNGMLLLDGVQVGGTAQIIATTTSGGGNTNYTTFNIYQKIPAGTTKTLEVKADVYGCASSACASSGLDDGKTITVYIVGATTLDNAQGMKSLAMIDAPAASVAGNSLTVGSAALSLSTNAAYGNQTIAPGSDTKAGAYVLTAGAYDAANISGFTVGIATTSGYADLTTLSNLYVKYGTGTTSVKSAVAASNAFSVTETLAAGKSMNIEVWVTLAANASGAFNTTLNVTATKATDGSAITVTGAPATGQTISTGTGALYQVLAPDTPDSAIVNGLSTDVLLAKFDFSAVYEGFTVHTIQIQATTSATSTSATAATNDDYISIYLKYKDKDGVDVTSGALSFSGNNATFTNQTLYVPAGGKTTLSVYGNMNAVAPSGYANTGDGPQLGLVYRIATSGSQPTATSAPALWSKQMVLYKSNPTVGLAGGTTGTLTVGTNNLYAATIGADANDISVKKLVFYIKGGMATDTDQLSSFSLYKGGTDYTSKVSFATSGPAWTGTGLTFNGNATGTLTVTFSAEEVIAAGSSQTYYLKANLTGGVSAGEWIQTYILGDSAYPTGSGWWGPDYYATTTAAFNFIWSDRSYPRGPYTESTSQDWTNGYLVKTLPSDVYTLKY